jgi:DNA invertase Pin-like site-specific DNA recombinase
MSLTEEKKPEIIALLLEGKTLGEIVKATGVSKSQIWRIKEQIKDGKYQAHLQKVENEIGDLIAESFLLHLGAMNSIARIANEEGYVRQQNSRDIAELHRTLEKWTISILQASTSLRQQVITEEQQHSQHDRFDRLEIEETNKPIS